MAIQCTVHQKNNPFVKWQQLRRSSALSISEQYLSNHTPNKQTLKTQQITGVHTQYNYIMESIQIIRTNLCEVKKQHYYSNIYSA